MPKKKPKKKPHKKHKKPPKHHAKHKKPKPIPPHLRKDHEYLHKEEDCNKEMSKCSHDLERKMKEDAKYPLCGYAQNYAMEIKRKKQRNRMIESVILGFLVTLIISAILYFFEISINVILPVAAPILVGSITLIYMSLDKKH